MNPFRLLFSFRGRTGRAAFLTGVVVAIIFAIAGLSATSSTVLLPRLVPLLAPLGINAASVQTALWLLIGLVVLWMVLALTVKRLHDRGHFGFWAFIAFVPMALMPLLESNLVTVNPLFSLPEPAHFAIWGVALLVAAWIVIECLLLPGSRLDDDSDDHEDGDIRRGKAAVITGQSGQ